MILKDHSEQKEKLLSYFIVNVWRLKGKRPACWQCLGFLCCSCTGLMLVGEHDSLQGIRKCKSNNRLQIRPGSGALLPLVSRERVLPKWTRRDQEPTARLSALFCYQTLKMLNPAVCVRVYMQTHLQIFISSLTLSPDTVQLFHQPPTWLQENIDFPLPQTLYMPPSNSCLCSTAIHPAARHRGLLVTVASFLAFAHPFVNNSCHDLHKLWLCPIFSGSFILTCSSFLFLPLTTPSQLISVPHFLCFMCCFSFDNWSRHLNMTWSQGTPHKSSVAFLPYLEVMPIFSWWLTECHTIYAPVHLSVFCLYHVSSWKYSEISIGTKILWVLFTVVTLELSRDQDQGPYTVHQCSKQPEMDNAKIRWAMSYWRSTGTKNGHKMIFKAIQKVSWFADRREQQA